MVTRRDFLKTMSMASAGLALGTGDLLHAQTASPKKGRGGAFDSYIGFQFHDAVWLTTHQSDGSHVIECKSSHGEFVEPGK